MSCSICGDPAVPFTEINKYCYKHIPNKQRCKVQTESGRRCKNPALPFIEMCPYHYKFARPKEEDKYTFVLTKEQYTKLKEALAFLQEILL